MEMYLLYLRAYAAAGGCTGAEHLIDPGPNDPGTPRDRAAAVALATYHREHRISPAIESVFGGEWDRLRA